MATVTCPAGFCSAEQSRLWNEQMSRQSPISKRTSGIRQAIRMFMVGEDGISGAALVEITIFAPMLLVSSIYIMDYGLYFFKQMEVQNAAQASAQYAIVNASAPSATDFTGNQITINSPTQSYYCPPKTPPPYTLTSVAQNTTCPDGSIAGKYITVTATATYNSFVRFGAFSKSSYTITGFAMVRVQ
jgi:Flp pilus assembly protein TadG